MTALTVDQAGYATSLDECLVCGGSDLSPVLELGDQYLVGFLDAPDSSHPRSPLTLMVCENCQLMQLRHVVTRDRLFRDYWYRSGVNDSMVAHLTALAAQVQERVSLESGDRVVDIGANDGTFLSKLPTTLHKTAFEPALGLWDELKQHADVAIGDYFSPEAVAGKAKLVTSLAMFYSVDKPQEFVSGVADILTDDGCWVCEMNYVGTMLRQTAFDFIGHEHVALYFLSTFNKLIHPFGLRVFDVEENPINGGSFRLWIGRKGSRTISSSVDEFLYDESLLRDEVVYARFVVKSRWAIQTLQTWATEIKAKNQRLYAYGASTRGMTLLQSAGLDVSLVPKAVDKNPLKVGKFMAGVNIPIVDEKAFRTEKPEYALMLPWGFAEEFVEREKAYLDGGGKMIVPLPNPQIIGGAA